MADVNPLRYRGYYHDPETGFYYLQSRYYDPQIGRFINADSYASTGVGYLGHNMFAYCNNDPINLVDPSGHVCRSPFAMMAFDGGKIKTDPIISQSDEPYGSMSYGRSTVARSGCGAVATYNAMMMLGRYEVQLDEIIEYYAQNNGMIGGGFLGTKPGSCISYFESQGYTVVATANIVADAEMARAADASILWYTYTQKSRPWIGIHFVAFQQREEVGTYYNMYSGATSSYMYWGNCFDLLVKEKCTFPVLILIFKNEEEN